MKILELMKKVPLKYWILIALAILFITAGMSRADKKLYNMIRENIEKDIRANEEMFISGHDARRFTGNRTFQKLVIGRVRLNDWRQGWGKNNL